MPKQGWKAITISNDVHDMAEKFILEYNAKKGMKEIRSMAHLVEMAILEYLEDRKKKET